MCRFALLSVGLAGRDTMTGERSVFWRRWISNFRREKPICKRWVKFWRSPLVLYPDFVD
jgi:hypothetical protein